jgi:hypothetical protein
VSKYCLIADFFYRDFTGGAELNDFSVIERFKEQGIRVEEKYCRDLTIEYLKNNKDINFIVANFVTMPEKIKEFITHNCKYIIYEHDHKYLKKRNPIFYKDFVAPATDLANIEFYRNANRVVCLTQLAVDIIKKNTGLENISKIGASVWTDADLDFILSLSSKIKNNKFAIMDSKNPIKKRQQCIDYCVANKFEFDLISDKDNHRFLEKLSNYKGLIFMTGHLETCCRLVVEAKMLNCKIIMQKKLIGAASEDWFEKENSTLIESIREISRNSVGIFLEGFNE